MSNYISFDNQHFVILSYRRSLLSVKLRIKFKIPRSSLGNALKIIVLLSGLCFWDGSVPALSNTVSLFLDFQFNVTILLLLFFAVLHSYYLTGKEQRI